MLSSLAVSWSFNSLVLCREVLLYRLFVTDVWRLDMQGGGGEIIPELIMVRV